MVLISRSFPVIVSAPSGGGKSTICSRLLKEDSNLRFSVTCTTRRSRPGEKHGRHYYFLDQNEFERARTGGMLLEWARVHGHFYGTPRKFLEDTLRKGKNPLMTIDVQGAMAVKKKVPGTVTIFLFPPDWDTLRLRLVNRRETPQSIRVRLKTARREIKTIRNYDYIVVNEKVDRAVSEILTIISAERLKTERRIKHIRRQTRDRSPCQKPCF